MTEPHEPEDAQDPPREETSATGSPEWSTSPTDPPTEPGWGRTDGPAAPPRQRWWRSHRVRVGATVVLAALVLLGGGFGAGYAVADASAPATHVAAAKAHPRKAAGAKKKREQQQQQGTAPPPGTIPG